MIEEIIPILAKITMTLSYIFPFVIIIGSITEKLKIVVFLISISFLNAILFVFLSVSFFNLVYDNPTGMEGIAIYVVGGLTAGSISIASLVLVFRSYTRYRTQD